VARVKDEVKRGAILESAKRLFAIHGFDATSMGQLAHDLDYPVGSIYTYFPSKKALLESIIEEGWNEFIETLVSGLAAASSGGSVPDQAKAELNPARLSLVSQLSYLVYVALPSLFKDVDLITILLAEAGKSADLETKMDKLVGIILSIIDNHEGVMVQGNTVIESDLKTGLAIILLGSLETVRVAARTDIRIANEEVVDFIARIVETSVGISLPVPGPVS
jgi:AcrR family transcriptional regulator